jgi:hypothetical protein
MHTDEEYLKVTNERLDKMGYTGEQKKTIQMLLFWSYMEGGLDADKDTLERIEDERTSQKDYK